MTPAHDGPPAGARAWDERYAAADLVWSAGPNVFVERECSALAPGHAVDLACGEGRNALWLASRGWQVTGVDFSAVAVEKARRIAARAGQQVRWEVADVLAWSPPAPVDLVLLVYVHLPPDGRRLLLAGAAAAVAPGGSLLVVGHDRRNLGEGVGGPQDPDLLWTPDDVDLPGWEVCRRGTEERVVDGGAVALDTVARLVRPRAVDGAGGDV